MKRRVTKKLVLLGLAVVLTFTLASVAAAQPGEFVKGVLQPLADGFPKRPITLIVCDDPGSKDDLYAKAFQTALKDISPVRINTSNEPANEGGTWFTLKDIGGREGGNEGYYPIAIVGFFGVVTDIYTDPSAREVGANVDQLKMTIATETWPDVMIQRKNAPWGPTFAGLIKYMKENPNKARYISWGVGGGKDIACTYFVKTLGGSFTKIPQGTAQEAASTVGAGEGDYNNAPVDVAFAHWKAGRVDVTMVQGDVIPPPWDKDPNVTTTTKMGLNPAIGGAMFGFGVPAKVPQSHVDWLYKLFNAAASTEGYQKRGQLIPGLVFTKVGGKMADGAWADGFLREILKTAEPVVRDLGLHLDYPPAK